MVCDWSLHESLDLWTVGHIGWTWHTWNSKASADSKVQSKHLIVIYECFYFLIASTSDWAIYFQNGETVFITWSVLFYSSVITCHRKFSNINLDDSPELASWHGQHWNQVIYRKFSLWIWEFHFHWKAFRTNITPWIQAFLVALADTSSQGFQSFERVDNSNWNDRSLKIEVFSSWRFSQLRSWRSRGSGWCHGWHRRKSPKIYTQVGNSSL